VDPGDARTRSIVQRPGAPRLAVISGGLVTSHALPAAGEVVIGRAAGCDLRIDAPSLSRRHVRLQLGAQITVEDLGSRNGTIVAGKRLATGAPCAIGFDEIVTIGAVGLVIQQHAQLGPATAEPSPALPAGGAMQRLRALAERVAVGDISVLILGETGVGKEVLADFVHGKSRRAARPLVKLNCAALPEHLLESELFGHERGAFTGAVATKPGLLEQADGGSVFLDEIGELPLATQAKLLRVIEQREILRVGGLAPRAIDVRFLAATHRDLPAAIAAGRFREDLYFRIAGVVLQIPPLRDRPDEILALAERFARAAAQALGRETPALTPEAEQRLRSYPWPGNVRELRNAIERATLLSDGAIGVEQLPGDRTARPWAAVAPGAVGTAGTVGAVGAVGAAEPAGLGEVRVRADALERQAIEGALERAGGNQTEAARQLGISRRTLTNKLNLHGFDRPRKRR
jgi:DNA-binding NtrC family response regulator